MAALMRRALAIPLLLLFLLWGSQNGSAQGPDADGDGVADAADNCAAWPNPDQADADANGVGNACECGDQNGDGVVDVADLVAINLAIFDPARVTALCDASADGRCDVADIIAANAKIFGRPAYCARYPDPAPPDVDGDGDGFTPAEGDCRDGDTSVYPNAPVVTGTFGGGNLAPGVCFAARGPDGDDPRSGPDGCSGISLPGVLDANNPAGCADSRFGSGDADQPLPCGLHDAWGQRPQSPVHCSPRLALPQTSAPSQKPSPQICSHGAGSVGVGGSCTTANACSNDICQLGCCGRPLTAACTSNSQCCSNRCVTDLLGNRSCALF
jgi:hypothetical protein